MQTPVATTRPTRVVCLTCGAIKKTGKLSCCARGGSWFGKCGGAGDTKFKYTWVEGIQACKARQSKAVIDLQQTAVEEKNKTSSIDPGMIMTSKTVIMSTVTAPSTVLANTATTTSTTTPVMQIGPIAPAVKSIHTEADRVSMREASIDVASPHTSASTSLVTRGYEIVSVIAGYVGLLLIIGVGRTILVC